MTPDEARARGAQALFGEKYGDEVRVVSMGREANSGKGQDGQTYSLELCGGTHVARTGDIGAFVCLGDSASAAGIRRVEALTGQAALDYLRAQDTRLGAVAGMLKAPAQDVPDRVKALMDERRALANEISQLKRQIALGGGGAPGDDIQDIGGLRIIAKVMTGVSGKDLPAIIDAMKEKLSSGAVVLIADTGTKPAVAAGVTQDMTARISAVDLVRICVGELGGKGGGGRPDMAQGGGTDITGADRALAAVKSYLEGMHA
jgi:alanyl-tRNA synthetase